MRTSFSIAILSLSGLCWAGDGSFVSVGLEMHYRTAGSGAPIVFLSGGPGLEVDYILPAAEGLPTSYERIFLEQRGTGRSRPAKLSAENLSLKLVVDDLEALRIHLKQDRLLLLGHSWGGMLAMAYAAAYPDRVDRLILVDSGGPTLEFQRWFRDNIEARLHQEDLEAQRYWVESEKHGVDREKAGLEEMRAITPGYFFDRAKALEFAVT
jgi:proline iminopeptidase